MSDNIPPSSYKHLTDVQVMQCLTLSKCGKPVRVIADEVGCSKSTVDRILKEHDYETFITRPKSAGRPRKTTESDDRLLIRIAKQNHRLPFRDITNLSGLQILAKTTVRRCREVQLISRYACSKPYLTAKHKKDRLEWALRYIDWTEEEWFKVIWSDECIICIGQNPKHQRVLHTIGTAVEDRNLVPSFKSKRVSIMIWACFSGNRLGPLLTFEQGGIDSDEYMDILYEGLIPMIEDLLVVPEDSDTIQVADENTLLFMHDNAPCHKTEDVQRLLQENNIPVMTWPANSPDLNPIENLWRDLKDRFYLKWKDLYNTPSASQASVEMYKTLIVKCWAETDWDYIRKLMKSMHQRCADVIAAKGGHTTY